MAIRVSKKRVRTSNLRRKLGPDEAALLPAQIDVPAEPSYAKSNEERLEYEEQQVVRVELMMLKGIRNKRQLMALLGIEDSRALDRFMRRVYARWEMNGTTQEFTRHRGEGLARLDLIESEAWSKLANLDEKSNPQASINYLGVLLKVHERRSELLGLTPKIIATIGSVDDSSGDVVRRIAQQDRLTQVMLRMTALIEERQRGPGVIEHEPRPET